MEKCYLGGAIFSCMREDLELAQNDRVKVVVRDYSTGEEVEVIQIDYDKERDTIVFGVNV
jgi:hypothetical protein